jgi:hypothetical protein
MFASMKKAFVSQFRILDKNERICEIIKQWRLVVRKYGLEEIGGEKPSILAEKIYGQLLITK